MDSNADRLPRVRWMRPRDVESVLSIEQDDVSGSWTAERFATEIAHPASRYVVVEAGGRVIGFGGLWLGVDEAHVVTMAVRENLRRHRYGAVVLRGLLAVAMDLGILSATLECRESNLAAQALYRTFGFVSVGDRPGYYDNGEDAVIMTTDEFDSRTFQERLSRLDADLEAAFPGLAPMPEGTSEAERG